MRLLLSGRKSTPKKKIAALPERLLLTAKDNTSTSQRETLFSGFNLGDISAATQEARTKELGQLQLQGPTTTCNTETKEDQNQDELIEWSDDDFDDDLPDFTLAGRTPSVLPSPRASPSAASQNEAEDDGASWPPLSASVKFSCKEALQLMAPRPLEDPASASESPSPT